MLIKQPKKQKETVMVSYFKIDYSLKNSKGEIPDFYKFPTYAYIVASTANAAIEKLKAMWNSWNVNIHNISNRLEMTDAEYNR